VSTVLLDSHVLYWLASEPSKLSAPAIARVRSAELAVSDVTWFELAWLVLHGRIRTAVPPLTWLQKLSALVRTEPVTPQIAIRAASLPDAFPGDPSDRLIFATAAENGWNLVTKDDRIRAFPEAASVAVW
jgi:PIN domain nuclease of toxin-antitoxin system